jgi:hypothetical protein
MPIKQEDRRKKDKRTLPLPQQAVSDTVEIQYINKQIDDALKELDAAKDEAQTEADKMGITLEDLLRNPLVKQRLDPKIAAYSELVKRRSALLGRRSDTLLMTPPKNVAVDQGQPLDQSIDDLVQELAKVDEALKKAYSPPPVSADVAGLGSVSVSKEQISVLENSKREIEDQLDNLLMKKIEAGSGQEQQVIKSSDMVLDSGRSYLGDFPNMGMITRETEPVLDFGEPRRVQPPGQPNILFTGDRAEVRRILNDPERQRYKAPAEINPEVYVEPTAPAPTAEGKRRFI